MAIAIAAHDITLAGFDRPYKLLDFQMELQPNTHGWAKLLLQLTEKPNLAEELPYNSKLTIKYETSESKSGALFCGIVEFASIKRINQYYTLAIDLITGSVALDRDVRRVAYQDDTMTYSQVVENVLAETDKAKAIFVTEYDPVIGGMLIRYDETGWEFTRRLASHLGEAIFPDWVTGTPAFYFGTKMNINQANVELRDYTVVVDQRFYEEGGFPAGFSKRDFICIRVETADNYEPGTQAEIQGITRCILYKHGVLDGDQIRFTYNWHEVYKVKRREHEGLTGAMFSGTVLETKDERIRMKLDIDAVEPGIFHLWAPITGNIFYCMPEVGTRAMLYLGSHLESSAKAVENVRENGGVQLRAENGEQAGEEREYHGRFKDTDNRYFASQGEKELSVLPASIGLGPREEMPKILVTDDTGVVIKDLTFTLRADDAVAFQGNKITVTAPAQISMIRTGKGLISTFNISKDFNVCGTIGSMKGTQRAAISIPKRRVLESLGNPVAVEQAAITSVLLGCTRPENITKQNTAHTSEETTTNASMGTMALSLLPLGRVVGR